MEITVTEAKTEDVYAISDVQKETWLATYPNEAAGITREDILSEDFRSPGRIEKRIKIINDPESNTKFFVAKSGEKVIGYCCAQKLEDSNKLRSLYVLPTFQGKGTGKKLIEMAFDFMDSSKPIKLTVATYNENAIVFYEKLGFKKGQVLKENPEGHFASGREIPEMEMTKESSSNIAH